MALARMITLSILTLSGCVIEKKTQAMWLIAWIRCASGNALQCLDLESCVSWQFLSQKATFLTMTFLCCRALFCVMSVLCDVHD